LKNRPFTITLPPPLPPALPPSLPSETVAILVTCNFLLLLLRVAPSFYLFLVLTLGINFILAEALSKSLYTGKAGGKEEYFLSFIFAIRNSILTLILFSSLPPSLPPYLPPSLPPPPPFKGALTGPVSSLLEWMCVSPLIFLVALIGGREERAMARSRGGAASVAGADGGGMGGRWMKEKEGGTAVLERRNTRVGRREGRREGGREGGRGGIRGEKVNSKCMDSPLPPFILPFFPPSKDDCPSSLPHAARGLHHPSLSCRGGG